jgi:hypothetical protein
MIIGYNKNKAIITIFLLNDKYNKEDDINNIENINVKK